MRDAGLHPDGSYSTTQVSDHGARLAAGAKVVVAQKSGDWLGVSYLGDIGWLYSPKAQPVVIPSRGETVSARPGARAVTVDGRGDDEQAAHDGTRAQAENGKRMEYREKAAREGE